ncbi:tetratricopeptide repeat protein [Pseudoalteromonas sp. C2R02]|uniref:tetratricopeptide repeat protein n=1 Tax=Pseudoalteromonas sp. C2R02 TaxID=2841565 RepID=UPI001C08D36A|nr:tetratricopeptide repeat protein [Pseudoalteromonas sp. C2R02]MBU2972285.1 tetratricopeptide repeat protein [Pseudoalteromonas sp. C2R02]
MLNLKACIVIILFVIHPLYAHAIENTNDAIKQAIKSPSALNTYLNKIATNDAKKAIKAITEFDLNNKQPTNINLYAQLYNHATTAYLLNGEKTLAQSYLNKSLSLIVQVTDDTIVSNIYFSQALISSEQAEYEQAILILNKAISLYPKTATNKQLGIAYQKLADNYLSLNQHTKALNALFNSSYIFKAIKDPILLAEVFGKKGSVYRTIGDFDKALENMLLSIKALSNTNKTKKIAIAYNNTAIIYKDLGRYTDAIDMHKKSLRLKESIGYEKGMVYSFNNLGETYRLNDQLEQSITFLDLAEKLATELNNRPLLGSTFLYKGRIALQQKKYQLAISFFDEAMSIYLKRNAQSRIAEGNVAFGEVYFALKQYKTALDYYQKGLNISLLAKKNTVTFAAYQGLVNVYQAQKDYENAFISLEEYQTKRSQLFDEQSQKRLESLIVEKQLFTTQQQLKFSQQDAKLKQALLDKSYIEKNIFIASLIIVLTIMFLFYRKRQQAMQRKQEQEIHQQVKLSEQRLNLALWGSGDILWDWDLKVGAIKRENLSKQSRLPTYINGNTIDSVKKYVHPDDFELLAARFNTHLTGKTEFFEASYRVLNKAGEWNWILDRGKVVERDSQNQAIRITGTQRDITLIKHQEIQLRELNDDLEDRVKERTIELESMNDQLKEIIQQLNVTQIHLVESEKNAAMGNMIAGLAHEINTPLGTAITTVSHLQHEASITLSHYKGQTLSKTQLSSFLDIVNHSSNLISKGVGRASGLVERFKQLSLKVEEKAQTYPLYDLVKSSFGALKVTYPEQYDNTQLILNVKGDATTHLNSLTQVLFILMENSFTHGQRNGLKIECSSEIDQEYITITYIDNGVGISIENEKSLFSPFFTTSRDQGLTGLGLHIAFNITSQVLGGSLSYFRPSNQGVGFKIKIKNIVQK